MNLLEILNENSILLEAVRINNSRDAYELIKNKKLGVKIHPSYNINEIENTKEEFMQILDKIITKSGANDKVFTVQFFMNKVPMNQMLTFADRSYIFKAISYRNKPWAKDYPGYKEFISLDGKDVVYKDLNKLVEDLEIEAQRHGHGDKKEVKNLYNDGTWTLQVPTSFKGAKSISFSGRKGKKQIPTGWCTRTDIFWYNKYAKDSPLYVIRNWENGKAYQISFNKETVNFLDQDDVKGDEITKGDLSSIPDELLELIKWNGRSLKDFKKSVEKSKNEKITKGSYFKDPTSDLQEARWGRDIKLSGNVIKNVWENFADIEDSKMNNYMVKHKDASYVKHDGWWAAKYYFRNEPDFFILLSRMKDSQYFEPGYYWDGDEGLQELDSQDFGENIPETDKLLEIALKDIGQEKNNNRYNRKLEAHKKIYDKFEKAAKNELNTMVSNDLSKISNKYLSGSSINLNDFTINKYSGGFLPYEAALALVKDGKTIARIMIEKSKGIKYKVSDFYTKEIRSVLGDKADNFINEINTEFNKIIMSYSKNIMKNREGSLLRNNAKIVDIRRGEIDTSKPLKRVYYENYFPY